MKEIWCPLEDMKKERLWYAIVIRDDQGEMVAQERRKSHSFLIAWNQLVYSHMWALGGDIRDTGGVVRTVTTQAGDFNMTAPLGNTDYGIRVGTGNTAVDISDFALEIPIAEGGGAGQMDHLACTVAVSAVAAPNCSFLASRTITNNSGGLIIVREAVIYTIMSAGPPFYCCVTRDVLTVPQGVPNGGSITIDWTIGVTV